MSARIREALRVAVLRRDNEKDPETRAAHHERVMALRTSLGLRTLSLAAYETWLTARHTQMVARANGGCVCGGVLREAHGMSNTLVCTGRDCSGGVVSKFLRSHSKGMVHALTIHADDKIYAAIGSDGVVYGLGTSEKAARRDAGSWLEGHEPIRYAVITDESAGNVLAGDVGAFVEVQ
jgi:hypothetical protein